ncbi:Putative tyrosine protein kinase [Invertebrate iridescent virus 30]|uniref:Putative tyrosine protein kinase n=1 Tax=Invertebrate iridescent virus 30 TaxID=345585 RepID=W8W1R4_9VIRU|nr:Putative tyrosine protein kinase [Invertebrate iridescent virus 30]CCV02277.1 Putative tyrosine protein kinase [Invertebrate iridescent virus 30]
MQLNHDYFTTKECKIFISRIQTNPRYKNFTQLYYTVGDVEQFWVERNLQNNETKDKKEPQLSKDNIFSNLETFLPFEGYTNISQAQLEDTFNYIFNKFKKGIFIKISGGQLESFIPFSKAVYTNEWSHLIKIDPNKYTNLEHFFKVHHNLVNKLNKTNYKFNIHKIQLDPSFWFANNCILRYENPINEGENNYAQLKSMFLELCAERQLPDIEFFVNRRDFPILTRNGTEPYNNIFGDDVPLLSYKFDKYLPILSMCSSDKFADIAIPTHEDWARIKSNEGIYFPPKCRNYTFKFETDWKTKKNIAVFRGSNTGCGFNVENNTRLKLAKLSTEYPQYLNCGITNWNLRVRKNKDSEYLQIPDVENLQLVEKLTPEQQSNYKYLINLDGHVSAFRLSLELEMGCCILLVESPQKWKMWFSDYLEPYVHYVPVKSDLSDLIEQVKWCQTNDNKCQQIAQNSLRFAKKYLSKKGILDNLEKTIFQLHLQSGGNTQLKVQDPLIFQSGVEHQALMAINETEHHLTGLFPKNIGRNYGSLKGFEKFISQAIKPDEQITLVGVEVKPLFKSKTTRIILYQVGAEYLVGKRTIDSMKKIEFIHEAFIGKFVINNLLKWCPNFVFTLGYRDEQKIRYMYSDYNIPFETFNLLNTKETTVLQEYIQGPTLQEFLKTCTLKSYIEILLSLCCALVIAQTNYGFVHHDLKPWNIIVTILPEPIIIEYLLRVGTVYKIKTKFIPVILDYGKSRVIYNNVSYGIIEPFTMNKYIDLCMLLISTLNELLLHQKENVDTNDLIYISNFLSSDKITDFYGMKKFITKNKKFGNLNTTSLKLDLKESKTIFEEFFKYMIPLTKKYKISFGKDALKLGLWSSNARQITDMGFGLELEDKVNSYLEVVRRIYKNPMPQASNKFTSIMIAQKMLDGLIIPKMEFVEFASQANLNKNIIDNVLNEFNKMEKFLIKFYTTQIIKKKREPFNLGVSQQDIQNVLKFDLQPSRRLFLSLNLNMVTEKLKNLPAQFPDYLYYHSTIIDVLRNQGPFKINEEDKVYYLDKLQLIFDEKFISKVVDIETIRFFMNL